MTTHDEAQATTTTTTTTTTLVSVPPAYTQTTHTPSASGSYSNAFDDFFGMSATRESRHDNRSSMEIPAGYPESLPAYSPLGEAEPTTLAMYLFKFGFLFPPFWILGVFILLSPLSPPPQTSDSSPSWLPEKSDEERQFVISEMRRVEVKWGRRCLWALLIFTILAVAAGVAIWAVLRFRS